ncbi:MAG: efflux RND transporter periplasmic adaptor subunit [Pseudomonadota bacterium]
MKFYRRSSIVASAASLLVLLSACGGAPDDGAADDQDDANAESAEVSDEESEEDEGPPVPVETSVPSRGDIYAVYSGTAPIEAFAEADVIAKVEGEVRELLVEEGDSVRKGQILARLDGDRKRLALNESKARLDKLRRDYERNVDLSEKGLISVGDFENIKYEMEALEASYNLASLELDYTQVRSPIDGVVSERYIKLGNTLPVNHPVFRVTSLDPLVAYLHIPEREFRNIQAGQQAAIAIDAMSGDPVIATVTRVSPTVDANTGTFKATIEMSGNDRRIKPGMFARIGVIYDTHANALQVPRSAIIETVGNSYVFVIEDGIAVRKKVETGFAHAGMVEITAGLADDDSIITVGQVGLKPDSKVVDIAVIEAEAAVAEAGDDDEEERDAPSD